MISRRKLLSSLGLATAIAALPGMLMVPDAEAQTAGMERRQDRREGRQERRDIPLSVVTAPQVDAEIFHAQHDRVRGNEEPDHREVERETLHA